MTEPAADPRALYDATAERWARRGPSSLSDFTARPAVFDLCAPVAGARVLDLGCGEGYGARALRRRGAETVLGVDRSPEMVDLARRQEAADRLGGLRFEVGDASRVELPDDAFDLVVAIFLFNYLTLDETVATLGRARAALRPGGRMVFSVPHPAFPWLRRDPEPPFYFRPGDDGYFSGRGARHPGEIHRRDGTALSVQAVHKTFEDYVDALRASGFDRGLPLVRELGVRPEHLADDPGFFGPVADLPLHLAFVVERGDR